MTRVDDGRAGPVARWGTDFGTCRSGGTDCVCPVAAPLPGAVSAGSAAGADERPPQAPRISAETSRATTPRGPAHMLWMIPRPFRPEQPPRAAFSDMAGRAGVPWGPWPPPPPPRPPSPPRTPPPARRPRPGGGLGDRPRGGPPVGGRGGPPLPRRHREPVERQRRP